jgi:hypothetical protein
MFPATRPIKKHAKARQCHRLTAQERLERAGAKRPFEFPICRRQSVYKSGRSRRELGRP